MNKNPPISFCEYQESLLENGMAIAADCTHECYGGIIFNLVIENPSCDLLASMRGNVSKALADKFQERHKKFKSDGVSDDEYKERLLADFASTHEARQYLINERISKQPNIEWIDGENPKSGIMTKVDRDMWSYFDVRANPRRFKQILSKEFGAEVEPSIKMEILKEIDFMLEEQEIDPDDPIDSYQCDWDEMFNFGWFFLWALSSQKKKKRYEKVIQSFIAKMFLPVFDNYKDHLFFVAAEDTTFFEIGRPFFYPIIAGERLDGSHEITIFEAYNEI
jgi:hypothetical protein